MSRYLYGVEFAPRDLKLALVEASEGKIGSLVDQMMLFCYHYDPETGKYGLVIMNFVRAAGALTVLLLAGWIVCPCAANGGRPARLRQPHPRVLARCRLPFPLFPPSASTVAAEMDLLYLFIVAVCAFFTVLVAALVVFFTLKYRRRHPDDVGADIHGSLALELGWTFIPFVLSMVMFGWGASLFFRLATPPANAMEVFVVGKQWMWKVQHPEGVREINELHVPIGRPVRITLGSEDVLHDYFIPAFRVKMDAVPGKLTTMWFEATKVGHVSHLLRGVLRHEALRA